ncbi:UDP-2,3-diacylglucosamine hydrolase (lipid_A_lpxH) [Candidatus Glomeribacter gigasporarum BEG34]|uniref:UDP-2,3-diacylglucosamine hydrolase n=1 Tax=Candidatus Glomeribacter gigasporarum BEG34 TaxID=1070319 RepID=G2J889_9BURK|nr:UDP-2,3-diacylglucosamine diphosphatase [Candidatus Glomeribacter gigasporarum]CCD28986.1 UDP-2,3-diacylglucosamine hydrolase (lipid_A_lpxH) [Candidatus Glomeribacter gigasporarum BEG34]
MDSRPLYFISDLHLSAATPKTYAAFAHFIETTVDDARAVYILGDLFDYWVGDEMLSAPFAQQLSAQLRTLAERGIALYVMPGNRDFLLGARFEAAAGAQLLEEPAAVEALNHRFVLTHGDALCTEDRAYQRFRRCVRCRAVQRFFLRWPMLIRLILADCIRALSRMQKQPYKKKGGDVTLEAVMQLFAQSGASIMIHGHTHRPARHQYDTAVRWVLSDWDFDGGAARGAYLRLDREGIRSISL